MRRTQQVLRCFDEIGELSKIFRMWMWTKNRCALKNFCRNTRVRCWYAKVRPTNFAFCFLHGVLVSWIGIMASRWRPILHCHQTVFSCSSCYGYESSTSAIIAAVSQWSLLFNYLWLLCCCLYTKKKTMHHGVLSRVRQKGNFCKGTSSIFLAFSFLRSIMNLVRLPKSLIFNLIVAKRRKSTKIFNTIFIFESNLISRRERRRYIATKRPCVWK